MMQPAPSLGCLVSPKARARTFMGPKSPDHGHQPPAPLFEGQKEEGTDHMDTLTLVVLPFQCTSASPQLVLGKPERGHVTFRKYLGSFAFAGKT